MNIIFEPLELQNFKSVGDPIILYYQSLKGFNYIFGTNSDSADGASNRQPVKVLYFKMVLCLRYLEKH